MSFAINPGSGPVADGTLADATENIRRFVRDAAYNDVQILRLPDDDADGRFGFLLVRGNACHAILMPGLPLARVRYMQNSGLDPWAFPRLYVDGASWLWCFALAALHAFKDDPCQR